MQGLTTLHNEFSETSSRLSSTYGRRTIHSIHGMPKPDVSIDPEQCPSEGANAGVDVVTVVSGDNVLRRFPQASSPRRQRAKDLAASTAYQWLRSQFPNINLTNV